MAHPEAEIHHFAGLTLDLRQGRLTGPAGDVPLRRKAFELLRHLARHAGQVISKDDLMAAVWPDVIVSDDSLTQCVHELRRALGPAGADLLRTVPRRGYLFAAPPASVASEDTRADPAPANRPGSIAIMPFTSAEPLTAADQLRMDGLANDIISRLAQLRSFHAISRASSFALRHLIPDPVGIGTALRVDYLVTGLVARQGTGFLLRLDLLRAADGAILWTQDLAFATADLLAMIDRLTDRIVAALASEITTIERSRALLVPEQALDAWALYHRGLTHAFRFDAREMAIAQSYFDRAIAIEPGFARAHGAASFCHYFYAFSGHCTDRAAEVRAAMATAERALLADERNPTAQWSYGRALWLDHRSQAGLQHARQAVSLSPSFAHARYSVGFIETHHGDPQAALDHLATTQALSPLDPFLASFQITRAIALARLGLLDQAVPFARQAAGDRSAYAQMKGNAAVILAAAGEVAEARRLVTAIRQDLPTYSAATLMLSLYDPSTEMAGIIAKAAPLIGL